MAESAYLVMVNVPDEDWSFRIDSQRKVLGRSAEAQIRVPARHLHVSRRHAEVWRDKNGLWLKDLHSRGGTRINGVWLEKGQQTAIMTGDRIALSTLELEVAGQVSKLAQLMDEVNLEVCDGPDDVQDSVEAGKTTSVDRHHPRNLVRLKLCQLTPAELDIVLWMYRGYTTDEELGRTLYRSPNTIRTQVASIFGKLGLHSRTEIVTWLQRVASTAPAAVKKARPTAVELDPHAIFSE